MESIDFKLGGKEYSLTRQQVKERLQEVEPKSVDKYSVDIEGRFFPPKQVLGEVLELPLISFTTMDANRVLARLGFPVNQTGRNLSKISVTKQESELLFETYLNASRLTEYSFERPFPESAKRPDYTLQFQGSTILFEVKEFRPSKDDFSLGFGAYDPYGPIREKIDQGRKKFQSLKEYACCLVLYNCGKPLIHLDWEFIYAAMLGNLAFQVPIDLKRGKAVGKASRAFAGGGKMIRYKDQQPFEPQNQTLSAVLVLEQMAIGKRRFDVERNRRIREVGRDLGLNESLEMMDQARGTQRDWSLTQLRVVVHENPYARIPLARDLFRGLYDERFGLLNDQVGRVFAGDGIQSIEAEEGSLR